MTGEYVGWLASAKAAPHDIVAGAGFRFACLAHPLTNADGKAAIADGRHAIVLMFSPSRPGVAVVWPRLLSKS